MKGNIETLERIINTYNRSPLGSTSKTVERPLDLPNLARQYVGTHGDHASDVKKVHQLMGQWKDVLVRIGVGKDYLFSKMREEREALLAESRRARIESLGGDSVWEGLSSEEKEEHEMSYLNDLCESLYDDASLLLSDEEKFILELWVWAGCGMHKDLNAVKGGVSGMKGIWPGLGIAPVELPNKDNAAVIRLEEGGVAGSESEVLKRAKGSSYGGASKTCDLGGLLLNHYDDKQGEGDVFRDYMKKFKGVLTRFPAVSKTRFGTYLEAAAYILTHLDELVQYIRLIEDRKGSHTLNNLETNFLKAIQDPPTLTELAVFAIYLETVSYDYMWAIRGEHTNALEAGPFHQKTKDHIKKLIKDPHLILSSSSDPRTATLGERECWKRPEVMRMVHEHPYRFPYLEELLVGFLDRALVTWERFTSEFDEDGAIVGLTESQKKLCSMPPTNDVNEGALGRTRISLRQKSTIHLETVNSSIRLKSNKTEEWMAENSLPAIETFYRQEARARTKDRKESYAQQ